MKLFKMEGYNLTISEEAFMLKPFKELWKRDKSKNKEKALQELSYIYYFCDVRSDYHSFIDNEERDKQIKLGEGISESWKPDKLVKEAIDFYNTFKSDSELLLEDLRVMVSKLRDHLKTIDLDTVDDKGKPIYSIDSYTKTVTDLNKLIKSIDETERTITNDLIKDEKIRGSQTKSMYEDI